MQATNLFLNFLIAFKREREKEQVKLILIHLTHQSKILIIFLNWDILHFFSILSLINSSVFSFTACLKLH